MAAARLAGGGVPQLVHGGRANPAAMLAFTLGGGLFGWLSPELLGWFNQGWACIDDQVLIGGGGARSDSKPLPAPSR